MGRSAFSTRLHGFIERSGRLLDEGTAALNAALVAAIAALMFAEIAARAARASDPWSSEISSYMMIAVVFLGAGWVEADEGMVRVHVLRDLLTERGRELLDVLEAAVCLIGACGLTWIMTDLVRQAGAEGDLSPTVLRVPLIYVYALGPIGGVLLVFRYLRRLLRTFMVRPRRGTNG